MARIARLAGSSAIRPARLGIAFEPTLENMALATSWATKSWGGVHFPLLDSSEADRSLGIAEGFGVDAIWALDDTVESIALARTEGFFWRSFDNAGPFDEPRDPLPSSLLSPDWAISEGGSGPFVDPRWDTRDPLRAVFEVWFGNQTSHSLRSRYQNRATLLPLEQNDRIPSGVVNFYTPIAATTLGVTNKGLDNRVGLISVDAANPQSLMHFWNLRAAGANVFPWVVGFAHRLFHLFQDWLSVSIKTAPLAASRTDSLKYISLWRMTEPPEILSELPHLNGGREWKVEDDSLHLGWIGDTPLSTPFNRTFSVQFDPAEPRVSVPLPPGPPARYASNNNVGVVAAQVSIYSEAGLKPGVVATAPFLREYSRLLDTMANYPSTFERVVHEGRAVSVAADAHEVEIGFTTSLRLFQQLFAGSSWKLNHTEGGRLASRIIEMLGGVERHPGNQPAIRRVLDDAAKSASGKKIPTLIQIAKNFQGAWPGRIYLNKENYPKNTVYGLLHRKLLQPFLQINCPHCGTKTTVRPEGLFSDMECEICTDKFPLGLALGVAPGGKNEWVYRLTGNLSADRIAEIMPVAATQSVLTDVLSRGKGSVPHFYGIALSEGKWKCEVDVVVVADGSKGPLVIIGEVKSYLDSIDRNDLDNLMKVQAFLESKGIECLILAATLREKFSERETADLRYACESMISKGRLPIILNGRQLSVPEFHADYPGSWDSRFDISSLAAESCRRNLGFISSRNTRDSGWIVEWEEPS